MVCCVSCAVRRVCGTRKRSGPEGDEDGKGLMFGFFVFFFKMFVMFLIECVMTDKNLQTRF